MVEMGLKCRISKERWELADGGKDMLPIQGELQVLALGIAGA